MIDERKNMMMKLNNGRPYDEGALTRTGRRLSLWLSDADYERLTDLAEEAEDTFSNTLRKMIRECWKESFSK